MNDTKSLFSCVLLFNGKMINKSTIDNKIISGNIEFSDENKSRVRK